MHRCNPLCFAFVAAIGRASLGWTDARELAAGLQESASWPKGAAGCFIMGGVSWSCVDSQGAGVPEDHESSQPAGQSAPGQFRLPVLSPEQLALCNPSPFSSLLPKGFLVSKSLNCLPFFCPRAVRYGSLLSTSGWNPISPGILPVLVLQTPNHESIMQAP